MRLAKGYRFWFILTWLIRPQWRRWKEESWLVACLPFVWKINMLFWGHYILLPEHQRLHFHALWFFCFVFGKKSNMVLISFLCWEPGLLFINLDFSKPQFVTFQKSPAQHSLSLECYVDLNEKDFSENDNSNANNDSDDVRISSEALGSCWFTWVSL